MGAVARWVWVSALVICGLGMRDVSYDVELPLPLRAFRAGREVARERDVNVGSLKGVERDGVGNAVDGEVHAAGIACQARARHHAVPFHGQAEAGIDFGRGAVRVSTKVL